jgi:DNA-binding FrmR family transcriptional regulator
MEFITTTGKMSDVQQEVNTLNMFIEQKKPYDEISAKIASIDELLKEANAEIIDNRINDLLSMPTLDMFNDLIDNRSIIIKRLTQDAENRYELSDSCKQLSFVQIVKKAETPICSSVYMDLVSFFMDNLYRAKKDEMTVKGLSGVAPCLKIECAKNRKDNHPVFKDHTFTAMEKQLNLVLDAILPEGMNIKAVKADVKYLMEAVSNTKKGKTVIIREDTFVNEIFTMLYHRKNKIAYEFQSKMNAHKA